MGNCSQNFENIQEDADLFQTGGLANAQIGAEHQQLKPEQLHPGHLPHIIDEEAIQPTLARNLEPPIKVSEKSKSETPVLFPEASSVQEESFAQPLALAPKKPRPKLEELDLAFYHKLALPDYEYRPIPAQDRHLFANVETYQMKDNYGVKYLGEWNNNSIHGNGVLLSNTAKYIGQFKHGLKHYHGREILKNEVYEGMFEGGRRKGQGTRYTQTWTEVGLFDDQLVEGRIIYVDGREETKTKHVEIEHGQPEMELQPYDLGHPAAEIYTEKYCEQSELPPEWQDLENTSKLGFGSHQKSGSQLRF